MADEAPKLLTDLPADVVQHIVVRLTLAHHIARAATLTTWHVGAARAMWCASARRTKMCCTTSAGRSVSNFGIRPTVASQAASSIHDG